jgi:glycosyltransferase involved in cell wall biosynthesis
MTVSIIIPVYNQAAALLQAVASLLKQTSVPAEIVIVDDGSTDNLDASLALLRGHMLIVRRTNGGPAAARNTGISLASGDIIGFLDADDSFPPASIEARVRVLYGSPEIDSVFGSIRSADGRSVPAFLPGGMLVRRRALERVGLFDEELRAGEFIEWLDRARRAGLQEALIPDIILHRNTGCTERHASSNGAAFVLLAKKLLDRRRKEGVCR